jgi:hypothetical protein
MWYAGVDVTVSYYLKDKRYSYIMYGKEYTEGVRFSTTRHAVTLQKKM